MEPFRQFVLESSPLILALKLVLGVLISASLVGISLCFSPTGSSFRSLASEWNRRTYSWWIMGLIFGGAVLIGQAGVLVLIILAMVWALNEFCAPMRSRVSHLVVWFVVIIVSSGVVFAESIELGYYSILNSLCVVLGSVACIMHGRTTTKSTMFVPLCGMLIILLGLSSVILILFGMSDLGKELSVSVVVYLIVLTQLSDVLQYVCGKCFGSKRIAPSLSPNKTWAGVIGGVFCTAGAAYFLTPLSPFTWCQSVVVGACICWVGFVGGLSLSAIKRGRKIKDWGDSIPGHGGVLDRIDSLCFSAPFLLFVLTWIVNVPAN